MDCEGLEKSVLAGDPLGPEAEVHLGACPGCRELARDGGSIAQRLATIEPGRATPYAEIEHVLASERGGLSALQSASTPTRIALALVGAAAAVALTLALTPRADLSTYPGTRMYVVLSVLVVLLVWAVRHGLWPLGVTRPASTAAIAGAAALVPAVLCALPAAHWIHPASVAGAGSDSVPRAAACYAFGAALAIPALALFIALDRQRRGVSAAPIALAAAAGLVGHLALQLHCPLTHPAHLLLGHATVGLSFVAAYVWVVRRRISLSH